MRDKSMAWDLKPIDFNEIWASGQTSRFLLTSLVVIVGQDKEDILKNREVELAEEDARGLHVLLGHIFHQLQAHCETRVLDFTVIMFRGPHAWVDDKLELSGIEPEKRWEAAPVNLLQQFEELDTMLGVVVEILIDHIKGAVEDILHDDGNLVFHQNLYCALARPRDELKKKGHTWSLWMIVVIAFKTSDSRASGTFRA